MNRLKKIIKEEINNVIHSGMHFYNVPNHVTNGIIEQFNNSVEIDKDFLNKENNSIVTEGITSTYPIDTTLRYVIKNINDEEINFRTSTENNGIAEHIWVIVPHEKINNEDNFDFSLKLYELFNNCGYEQVNTFTHNDYPGCIIFDFQPIYPLPLDKEELGKYIFHVSTFNLKDKILKNGFVPKNGSKLWLTYGGRCYFFKDNPNLTQTVVSYIKQSGKINIAFNDNKFTNDNKYCLFRIDTSGLKEVKFYNDPDYPNNIAVFTYDNIPSSAIKGVKEFMFDGQKFQIL